MNERDERDAHEQDGHEHDAQESPEPVEGVDLDPDDGKKSIAVDTTERLQSKDEKPDFDDLSEDELEKERQARLDPENRPENAVVDNSDRTFNPETGLFEDSDVEPPEGAPFSTTEAEQSNSGETESESSSAEPKDREEATDAEQSKEAKESKDTEG